MQTELAHLEAPCPMRTVLERIGEKWTALVLLAMENGALRYSAVRRNVAGITKKVLTQRLRDLERDGLVERRVYDTVPPGVEYSLTPAGQELAGALAQLRRWAFANDSNAGLRTR